MLPSSKPVALHGSGDEVMPNYLMQPFCEHCGQKQGHRSTCLLVRAEKAEARVAELEGLLLTWLKGGSSDALVEACKGAGLRWVTDSVSNTQDFSAPATPLHEGCADPASPAIRGDTRIVATATAAQGPGRGDGGERPALSDFEPVPDFMKDSFVRPMKIMVGGFAPGNEMPKARAVDVPRSSEPRHPYCSHEGAVWRSFGSVERLICSLCHKYVTERPRPNEACNHPLRNMNGTCTTCGVQLRTDLAAITIQPRPPEDCPHAPPCTIDGECDPSRPPHRTPEASAERAARMALCSAHRVVCPENCPVGGTRAPEASSERGLWERCKVCNDYAMTCDRVLSAHRPDNPETVPVEAHLRMVRMCNENAGVIRRIRALVDHNSGLYTKARFVEELVGVLDSTNVGTIGTELCQEGDDWPAQGVVQRCREWLVKHSVVRSDGDMLVPATSISGALLAQSLTELWGGVPRSETPLPTAVDFIRACDEVARLHSLAAERLAVTGADAHTIELEQYAAKTARECAQRLTIVTALEKGTGNG